MDEITMFADLRPTDILPDEDLADIRAELFPGVQPRPSVEPNQVSQQDGPRAGRVLRFAAAAIVVAGIGGLGVLTTRQPNEPAARNETPPAPTQLDTALVPADRLLYPTETADGAAPTLTIVELEEGSRAMVQAPDGTLYRVSASKQGGYVSDPAADAHDIAGHRVVANADGNSVGYSWADGCVLTSVTTEAGGAIWAPEQVDLLDAFTVTDGAVVLDLPDSWNVIDRGSNAPLVQLSYTVELDGIDHELVLAQSLGASIAALGAPMGPMEPVTLADATPAWFEPDSLPFPRLTFTREGVAVWMWGEGLNVDDMIAAATLLAPAHGTWENLLTDGIEIEPTGTVPPGGQPDVCGTPTLSIVQ